MSPQPEPGREFVLTVSCPDRPGIIHAVASFLVQHSANIVQSQQFDDRLTDWFFMRMHFEVRDSRVTQDQLLEGLEYVAAGFRMQWQLFDITTRTRALLMVSKFGHCLNDLLFRWRVGSLTIDIAGIVSNHLDFEPLAKSYGLDYVHLPVSTQTKAAAEDRLLSIISERDVDLVVLARYMQVLSDRVCTQLAGRAINIHHSFLPSFKGARPYHQAHARGVKLVGATAHYVSADLDEGPIIEQDVVRVDHALSPEDYVAVGRDVEAQVLARAVKWHTEHRVLLNGDRTVVFR